MPARPRPTHLSLTPLEDRAVPATLDATSLSGTWSWSITGQDWFNGPDQPPVNINDADHGEYGGGSGMDHWGAFAGAQTRYLDAAANAGFEPTADQRNETTHGEFSTTQAFVINPEPGEEDGDKVQVDVPAPTVVRTGTLSYSLMLTGPQTGTIDLSAGGSPIAHIGDTLTFTASGQATDSTSGQGGDYPGVMAHVAFDYVNVGRAILPDLAARDLEVSDPPTAGPVSYSYAVSTDTPPGPVAVGFYWATGPTMDTAIGGPAYTENLPDLSVNTPDNPFHTGQFAGSLLGARPGNATYLLMKLDPADAVREGDENNNVVGTQLPVDVTVTAKFDSVTGAADPDGTVFGTYLTGVKLPNVFTASVPAGDTVTKRFLFSIADLGTQDSIATKTVKREANGTAAFGYDVGRLVGNPDGSDRTYDLTVEALDAAGQTVGQFDGAIVVKSDYEVDLTVKATADGGGPQPVETARVLAGLPKAKQPELDFRAAVAGDLPDFYDGRVALTFFKEGTDTRVRQYTIQTIAGGRATLQGPVSAADFPDQYPDPGRFDYDAVLTPAVNFQEGKTAHRFDDPDGLLVVALPDWVKKNPAPKRTPQFAADAATAAQFGPGAAAYELPVQFARAYNLPLPETAGTPFGLLDHLKSGAELDAGLTGYAPLFVDQQPTFVADHFHTKVTYLSETLVRADLDPARLSVTGTLDAASLADPNTVTVATAQPISLIPAGGLTIDRDYGPWHITVPVFTVGFVGLNGTVTVKGAFHAAVSLLDLTGSVTFNLADGAVLPSQTTGTLTLDLKAAATAKLGVDTRVSVKVFDYEVVNLVDAKGTGAVTLDLNAHVAANFGGSTGLALDSANTTATADVKYDFKYDISFLTKDPKDPTDMKEATDEKSGSIWKLTL